MEMDMDTCIARHENRELGALCVWSVEAAPWPMRHEHGDTHKSQMEMPQNLSRSGSRVAE